MEEPTAAALALQNVTVQQSRASVPAVMLLHVEWSYAASYLHENLIKELQQSSKQLSILCPLLLLSTGAATDKCDKALIKPASHP